MIRILASLFLAALSASAAFAQDQLKIAIGQRGGWEQCVSELGQDKGFFKKHGLVLDLLYTQGSAETLQSVISNSVDIGIGLGTHGMLAAFVKGAPIRGVGGSFTSADEQFYYVPADSPIKTMKDAEGKTISISTNGSASNMFALHLARHFGVNLMDIPKGLPFYCDLLGFQISDPINFNRDEHTSREKVGDGTVTPFANGTIFSSPGPHVTATGSPSLINLPASSP